MGSNGSKKMDIFEAARTGNLQEVERFLKAGVDKESKQEDSFTPLWIASYMGHINVVQHLVQEGCDKNTRDLQNGWTPLLAAANAGHLEIVQLLGTLRIRDTDNDGLNSLHHAAKNGHIQIVKWLIKQGMDPLVETNENDTPFDLAKQFEWVDEDEIKMGMKTVMNYLESFRYTDTVVKTKAISRADELVILIDQMIPKRRKTINVIKDIAAKLTAVNKDVNIAKVVGCASSIVGWIAGTAGIIATGGIAAPLIIFGGITAISGAITNVGADIVGHILSKEQLTEAQNALDEDKKISLKIDKKKKKLDKLVDELGERLGRKRDEVFAEVMLESLLKDKNLKLTLLMRGIVMSTKILRRLAPKVYSVCNAAKMAAILEKVGVKGLGSMFGSVFSITTGVAFVILDVAVLVYTSVQLHKGSTTDAADDLILFAEKLVEGTDNLETMMNEFRDVAKKFQEEMIKEEIKNQLKEFSIKDSVTVDEGNALMENIKKVANLKAEWMNTMLELKIDLEHYVPYLAKIYQNFEKLLTNYEEKEDEKEKKRKIIPITMIGHGTIDKCERLPCSLYYMTESLKSVTLYQPWGCAIDATVIYAISVNNLELSKVQYTGEVLSSSATCTNRVPARPDGWNILPNDMHTIPTPVFLPLSEDEKAFKGLMILINTMPCKPDGIVIPYLKGSDIVDLPVAPLFVIANALALSASLSGIDIEFRYAACLTAGDDYNGEKFVSNSIYYSVDLTSDPTVCMRNPVYGCNEKEIRQWIENNNTAISYLVSKPSISDVVSKPSISDVVQLYFKK